MKDCYEFYLNRNGFYFQFSNNVFFWICYGVLNVRQKFGLVWFKNGIFLCETFTVKVQKNVTISLYNRSMGSIRYANSIQSKFGTDFIFFWNYEFFNILIDFIYRLHKKFTHSLWWCCDSQSESNFRKDAWNLFITFLNWYNKLGKNIVITICCKYLPCF